MTRPVLLKSIGKLRTTSTGCIPAVKLLNQYLQVDRYYISYRVQHDQ